MLETDMNISLENLADRAKVSKTTVSLVINGKSDQYRISKNTQKKILDLVQEFNFRPNSTARALRLNKSLTIGLIIPYFNRHFGRVAEVLEKTARQAGYQIIIAMTDDCLETEKDLIHNLVTRQIDGLILATMMNQEQFSKDPVLKKIPVLLIDRRIEGDEVGWVVSDDEAGTFELISTLCQEGIDDIYFIGGIKNLSTSIDRLNGYKNALLNQGIAFQKNKVQQTG